MMNDRLRQELERLKSLFASVDRPFPQVQRATDADLLQVYKITGIKLEGDIVDFYKYMNGSEREQIFAVFSDEATPCQFNSLASALEYWGASVPDVDKFYQDIQEAYEEYRQDSPRDARIKPDLWMHKLWFPFADFNGGATKIYWDADPGPGGNIGQIIVYQHDPDGIYYVAPDFTSFLKKSNDLLEDNRREFLEGIYE